MPARIEGNVDGTVRSVRADELDELLDPHRTLDPGDSELDPDDIEDLWEEMVAGDGLEIGAVQRDRTRRSDGLLNAR